MNLGSKSKLSKAHEHARLYDFHCIVVLYDQQTKHGKVGGIKGRPQLLIISRISDDRLCDMAIAFTLSTLGRLIESVSSEKDLVMRETPLFLTTALNQFTRLSTLGFKY